MSSHLRFTGIVLRKTKLGESDLIITFLAQDGSSVQAVAKGARRPKSSFASRLELFSCAELFCAQGKGLPLVQEARLVASHQALRLDFDRSTASSVLAELVAKSSHENVPSHRLFDLCQGALSAFEHAEHEAIYPLLLAACLKVFAFTGVRPSFAHCACCGKDIFREEGQGFVALSHAEGGCLCDQCASSLEVIREEVSLLRWLDVLLYSSFSQIESLKIPSGVLSFGFHFIQEWMRAHLGSSLKSIPFLLTNAVFPSEAASSAALSQQE